jgi:hypothetical protein
MPEPDAIGPVGAYARRCLAAARAERDWFRQAVANLEAAGNRIVQTQQPDRDGGPQTVLDWRTGKTLATLSGGQDSSAGWSAGWSGGWTDVCWIGAWLEDLADDGRPAADWPGILPPPPAPGRPLPLALALPGSLAGRLEEAIEVWAVAAGITKGRAAEVAELTGWTEKQVLTCTASWLSMTGEDYMRLGTPANGARP